MLVQKPGRKRKLKLNEDEERDNQTSQPVYKWRAQRKRWGHKLLSFFSRADLVNLCSPSFFNFQMIWMGDKGRTRQGISSGSMVIVAYRSWWLNSSFWILKYFPVKVALRKNYYWAKRIRIRCNFNLYKIGFCMTQSYIISQFIVLYSVEFP